ncbi:Tn3 family transposase [Microtetraspora fusca]|uniref:Tn3 family transposase n=1 Tax=Microtetraspora fusca TaxID=1997 RepID=A0ABW6VIM9_MICFU|nr:Tn3 family transposase [Microtetraspora fusca]
MSDEQVARYGRFAVEPSPGELEMFFRLDERALTHARSKRAPANRLGWAVQWCAVRMLGAFVTEDLSAVPEVVVRFAADQVDVDPAEFGAYAERRQSRYEHAWEIRDAFGYQEFESAEEQVRAFVGARVWASQEGPRALFDRAVVWLVEHRVLLPGITTLTRLVAEVRRAENARLYGLLAERTPAETAAALRGLLQVPEDRRVSELERLRTSPVKASGRVLVRELGRVSEIAGLGTGRVSTEPVPAAKLAALARYGMASKAPTLRDLEPVRQTATLLATVRHLETASIDDALDVLDLLITSNLLAKAERAGKAEQLRTLPKLRSAARHVASAMEILMGAPQATEDRLVTLAEVWNEIERVAPREKLSAAVEVIAAFVPESDDDAAAAWRAELVKRYRTVQQFIELLLETIDFRAVEAGRPVLAMVAAAAAMAKARRRYDRADIAAHEELVTGSWRPLVFANPDLPAGQVDKAAFTLCALMHLHTALRRRDVFAAGADRWSDPRARLLEGEGWDAARPRVLAALELEEEPAGHLAELASALEGAYTRVLDGLGTNTAIQFVGGRLRVEKLGPLAEPPLMTEFRALIDQMLPRVDFPELLLEVFDRTGLASDFTHISGADSPMEDFAVSLCGLIVAEACNVGLVPIEKPNVPALTRARLQQVDQGYLRAETISAANARMIAAQSGIDIVNCWGGGQIASADGLRFVVPVANLHTGHNPIYFGRQRGATWLNVVNDQVMGIGGLVVPGTLRDPLFILDAIHTIDGGPRPETVMTDTASYSDIVFGLFAICGYQFSPRIADLGDTRLWRTNTRATYGPLDHMSRHTVRLDRIRARWDDMLRVAGSLTTGKVRAYDLIRMLSRDGRPTGLEDAFAHYGRIFKTLHLLQFISDDCYRRMIGTQLNVQEGRHRLARRIAFGNRGQLRQRYREGMEDQLGALGLALNAVVWWNTLYLDAAVKQIRPTGSPPPTTCAPGSHPSPTSTSTSWAATPSPAPKSPPGCVPSTTRPTKGTHPPVRCQHQRHEVVARQTRTTRRHRSRARRHPARTGVEVRGGDRLRHPADRQGCDADLASDLAGTAPCRRGPAADRRHTQRAVLAADRHQSGSPAHRERPLAGLHAGHEGL